MVFVGLSCISKFLRITAADRFGTVTAAFDSEIIKRKRVLAQYLLVKRWVTGERAERDDEHIKISFLRKLAS